MALKYVCQLLLSKEKCTRRQGVKEWPHQNLVGNFNPTEGKRVPRTNNLQDMTVQLLLTKTSKIMSRGVVKLQQLLISCKSTCNLLGLSSRIILGQTQNNPPPLQQPCQSQSGMTLHYHSSSLQISHHRQPTTQGSGLNVRAEENELHWQQQSVHLAAYKSEK